MVDKPIDPDNNVVVVVVLTAVVLIVEWVAVAGSGSVHLPSYNSFPFVSVFVANTLAFGCGEEAI